MMLKKLIEDAETLVNQYFDQGKADIDKDPVDPARKEPELDQPASMDAEVAMGNKPVLAQEKKSK